MRRRWLGCVYRRQANSFSSRLSLPRISSLISPNAIIMPDVTEDCILIDSAVLGHNHSVLQSPCDDKGDYACTLVF